MAGAFPIARLGISLIAASGATKIISDTVRHVAVVETKVQFVRVALGSAALGGLVGDLAGRYTQQQIDIIHNLVMNLKNNPPEDPK